MSRIMRGGIVEGGGGGGDFDVGVGGGLSAVRRGMESWWLSVVFGMACNGLVFALGWGLGGMVFQYWLYEAVFLSCELVTHGAWNVLVTDGAWNGLRFTGLRRDGILDRTGEMLS